MSLVSLLEHKYLFQQATCKAPQTSKALSTALLSREFLKADTKSFPSTFTSAVWMLISLLVLEEAKVPLLHLEFVSKSEAAQFFLCVSCADPGRPRWEKAAFRRMNTESPQIICWLRRQGRLLLPLSDSKNALLPRS